MTRAGSGRSGRMAPRLDPSYSALSSYIHSNADQRHPAVWAPFSINRLRIPSAGFVNPSCVGGSRRADSELRRPVTRHQSSSCCKTAIYCKITHIRVRYTHMGVVYCIAVFVAEVLLRRIVDFSFGTRNIGLQGGLQVLSLENLFDAATEYGGEPERTLIEELVSASKLSNCSDTI